VSPDITARDKATSMRWSWSCKRGRSDHGGHVFLTEFGCLSKSLAARAWRARVAPLPVPDLRHVLPMLADVELVRDQLVLRHLLQVGALAAQVGQVVLPSASIINFFSACIASGYQRGLAATEPLKVRPPVSITLDGYAASHRAVRELPEQSSRWKDTRLRSSRYLNNMVEQDHRGVKSRFKPMLGFKVFDRAAVTIAGVELLHRIRKGQFNLRRLRLKGQGAPAIWIAVLSA